MGDLTCKYVPYPSRMELLGVLETLKTVAGTTALEPATEKELVFMYVFLLSAILQGRFCPYRVLRFFCFLLTDLTL